MSLFTFEHAVQMHSEGLENEANGLREAPSDGKGRNHVFFTFLAYNDWQFLEAAKFPGAGVQPAEVLEHGLALMRQDRMCANALKAIRNTGWILVDGKLSWVIRRERKRIIVHGIAQPHLNSYRKIWRYFSQRKALDLLRTGELYLRRLDLLPDQYECRPTIPMVTALAAVWRRILGRESMDNLTF